MNLPDMQKCTDGFPRIPINKVGVRNIECLISLYAKDENTVFTSMATISSYCDLVEGVKGINMSRIARSIFDTFKNTTGYVTDISEACAVRLQEAHGTNDAYLKIKFKYPIQSRAPLTPSLEAPEIIDVTIETHLKENVLRQYLTVEMVAMSLCPCSKEMSLLVNNLDDEERVLFQKLRHDGDYYWPTMQSLMDKIERAGFGAHNQKSRIKITVELLPKKIVWIEDLVRLINNSASAPVFSVLKRPDEKYVTEVSYMGGYYDSDYKWVEVANAGPKFVEDIARQAADQLNPLMSSGRIEDYVIVVSNQESIHSNNIEAVAVLSAGKNLK